MINILVCVATNAMNPDHWSFAIIAENTMNLYLALVSVHAGMGYF